MAISKKVSERIAQKKADYQDYNFTSVENDALKTFFDLAQEFGAIGDFYTLCVAVPKSFFGLDARLYLFDPKIGDTTLAATSEEGVYNLHSPAPDYIRQADTPRFTDRHSLVLPIRGK